jgi:hypothetical protein
MRRDGKFSAKSWLGREGVEENGVKKGCDGSTSSLKRK